MNPLISLYPNDSHNQQLLSNVHPADRPNPIPTDRYHLVVIGGGTAGLVTAAGSAGLGAKVALIERDLMGGDCLNWGCVPSKGIIRSARAYADAVEASRYGVVSTNSIHVDFSAVMERMRQLRAKISVHDSVERFSRLGIDVYLGEARFVDNHTVSVDGTLISFKKAVIATGAKAYVPPISGIEETGYLTNETIFQLTDRPNRLLIVGAGPIGCEMAQTFRRLGSEVWLVELSDHIMPREDEDAARIVEAAFRSEGIHVLLNRSVERVGNDRGETVVYLSGDNHSPIKVDAILVAIGRAPNVAGLNLEQVNVSYNSKDGILVNEYLQTGNPHIFAVGDCCMKYKFTHAADAAARIVIRNTLFPGKSKVSGLVVPWCTYTDPEVAHVGLSERTAKEQGIEIDTFKQEFDHVDRAMLDGEESGFVKIHVRKGTDTIVGATIVARHAGEMINEITMAMVYKIGLGKISSVIHPYPTQAEAIRKAADAYNRTRLTPGRKKLLQTFFRWFR